MPKWCTASCATGSGAPKSSRRGSDRRWTTSETGGTLRIFQKDLRLALQAADEAGVPVFALASAFQTVQLAEGLAPGELEDAGLIARAMQLARRGAAQDT